MWILGLKGLSILQHLNDTQSRVFVEECLLKSTASMLKEPVKRCLPIGLL